MRFFYENIIMYFMDEVQVLSYILVILKRANNMLLQKNIYYNEKSWNAEVSDFNFTTTIFIFLHLNIIYFFLWKFNIQIYFICWIFSSHKI